MAINFKVKGQLRALGTKQHLKNKFGLGYEVTVKLMTSKDLDKNTSKKHELTAFMSQMFKSSAIVSENGGLMTYKISSEEISIGKIFNEIESSRAKLCIEDYSVSQPTLEQVFITTVEEHEKLAARDQVRMDIDMDVVLPTNKCGCTKPFLWRYIVGGGFGMWVLLVIIAIAAKQSNLFAFAILFFLLGVGGCFSLYCPCFQKPADVED